MWAAGPVVAGLVPGEGWGAASGPRPWALPARRHAGRPCGPGIVAGPGLPAPPVGAPCDAASLCPQDIVAGDMSRRDLWEQKGGPKTSSTVKVRLNAADAGGGSSRWAGSAAPRRPWEAFPRPALSPSAALTLAPDFPAEHPVWEEVQVCGHRTWKV